MRLILKSKPGAVPRKRCNECNVRKPLTDFHKQSGRSKDGYRNVCKCCRRIKELERQREKRGG